MNIKTNTDIQFLFFVFVLHNFTGLRGNFNGQNSFRHGIFLGLSFGPGILGGFAGSPRVFIGS